MPVTPSVHHCMQEVVGKIIASNGSLLRDATLYSRQQPRKRGKTRAAAALVVLVHIVTTVQLTLTLSIVLRDTASTLRLFSQR